MVEAFDAHMAPRGFGWKIRALLPEVLSAGEDAAGFAFETRAGCTKAVPLRLLPEGGGWFETVWKKYQAGEVFGG